MPSSRRSRSSSAPKSESVLNTMIAQLAAARTRDDLVKGLGAALANTSIDSYSLLGFYGANQGGIELLAAGDRSDPNVEVPTGLRYPRSENSMLAHIALDVPTIFNDYATDPRTDEQGRAIMAQAGLVSNALFPLKAHGQTHGLLSLGCRTLHTFTPDEIATYAALADILAVALSTITAQESLEALVRRMETLYAVSATLAGQSDIPALLALATETLVATVGYRNAWLGMCDPGGTVVQGRSGAGVLLTPEMIHTDHPLDGPSMSAQVVRSGVPEVVDSLAQGRLEGWEEHALAAGLRTSIYVPLRGQAGIIGVLGVGSSSAQVSPTEVALLGAFANQVATTFECLEATAAQRAQLAQLEASYEQQAQLLGTIRELATPVLPIYAGIMILPLIGHLDTGRSIQIMEVLLDAIHRDNIDVAILDITGVPIIDTSVANHLIQATRAASLLGTTCLLVGITPEVAQTMVQLGIDMGQLRTRRNLQSGLVEALQIQGVRMVSRRDGLD